MELTPIEIKRILNYIIDNNHKLQDDGKDPIAINIIGPAGISKSAIIEQVAKSRGYNYIKLNLAQTTDTGDIVGYPLKEFNVCKHYVDHPEDDECKWISSEILQSFLDDGWELSGDSRLGYAIPAWLKSIDQSKPTIINLDDYSRCQVSIAQAIMEIIYKQEYISWKLPKYTTVCCTSNPDNGDYDVTSLDEAARTRLLNFNMKFDIKSWQYWAENEGIDGRCINFLSLYHSEIMQTKQGIPSKVNARNYTMFANSISGIKDWSTSENLAFILQIASGCFLDEDDIIGGLFTTFIANKLDKLISPEDLVLKSWDYIKQELEDQLYDGDEYRADIASVITTRFINYSLLYFEKEGAKSSVIIDRIIDIVDNKKTLLTEDLIFSLIKTLNNKYPVRCNKLLLNPKIIKRLV